MKINTFVKNVNKLGRHDEVWLQKLDKETGFVSQEVYLGDAQFISEEDIVLAMKKLNMTINDDNFDFSCRYDYNRQMLRNTNILRKITPLEYSIYNINEVPPHKEKEIVELTTQLLAEYPDLFDDVEYDDDFEI